MVGREQAGQACYLSSFQLRIEYSQLTKLGDGQCGKEKDWKRQLSLFISNAGGVKQCKSKQEKDKKDIVT